MYVVYYKVGWIFAGNSVSRFYLNKFYRKSDQIRRYFGNKNKEDKVSH